MLANHSVQGLSITTTVAGEKNILIFYDDIKCIIANGQMIINVGPIIARYVATTKNP